MLVGNLPGMVVYLKSGVCRLLSELPGWRVIKKPSASCDKEAEGFSSEVLCCYISSLTRLFLLVFAVGVGNA